MVDDRSLEVVHAGVRAGGQVGPLPAKLVCFGELLLRLSAPGPQLLLQREALETYFGGAEANVAINLAGFGHEVCLVSALPDNAIAKAARRTVTGHGVRLVNASDTDDVGGRMGLYFLQPGAMSRPAQVIYDREGSSFANLDPARLDWSAMLDGADLLFASGVTAALGEGPLIALQEAFGEARKAGIKIAFDTNYRPALWSGREAEAGAILRELSLQSDILFAGRRATSMMLGGDYSNRDAEAGFTGAAQAWFASSDTLQYVAATRRKVHSSDNQSLTALLADRQGVYTSKTIELERIIDRIGTGDAFATGIVQGVLAGLDCTATVGFAATCAEWAHSVAGDFMLGSLEDIQSMGNGSSDVRR